MTKTKGVSEWKVIIITSIFIGIILNIPLFLEKQSLGLHIVVADILFTFFATVLFISLLRLLGHKLSKVFISVLILFSVIAAYYMWFFGVVIGYGIIKAVFETELALSSESVGYQLIIFVVVLALLPIYFLFKAGVNQTQSTVRRYLERIALFGIATLSLFVIDGYYQKIPNLSKTGQDTVNRTGVVTHKYVPTNWIAASLLAGANTIANRELEKTRANPFDLYSFTENVNVDDTYVVIIIGESARRDRLSILGASRNTTPFLNKEKNLVAFKANSCNSSTSLSLECMFVHKGGVEEKGIPIQQLVHEGHLFQVFKGLGFSMELFAMQAQVGFYSKVGADSFKIREEIGAEAEKNGIAVIDDLLLIDQLQKSIKRHSKGKHVVILHQKGSHFLYSSRYPREFAQFLPECRSIDANCTAEEMFNAYDNTILYTDYFIKSVIDQLRDKKAMLIYASDHGESIGAKTHFHGTPKHLAPPEQLNIPIMLWASDSLLENKNIKSGFDAAKKHAVNNIVQHEQIFESVLGCLGYSSDNGGIRKENNWCANKANP